MVRSEYLRFLQTLNSETISKNERKIANLILLNLDHLASLGTHQGQRIKAIIQLAQDDWDTLSCTIQPPVENLTSNKSPITQLKSLKVGPFRGFAREESFDLTNNLVLIYGSNGTGKSSFCEALEYSLLGNVAEAESKRFRDQEKYFRNIYVDHFSAPVLTGLNVDEEEITIDADDALHRFCFVERNRIDNFSRIAAQMPAKQTELISTLFGLDSFSNFVRKFTTEIDFRYIDLIGKKAELLAQKRQALEGARQQIEINHATLIDINNNEQALASEYREGIDFNQFLLEVQGNNENIGLISKIEYEIQQPLAIKSSLSLVTLDELGINIVNHINEYSTLYQELVDASQQVSFKNLYDAVIQVQKNSPSICPACKTPLQQVVLNPFIHSTEELQKLQYLADQQTKLQLLERNIKQELLSLAQIISTCCSRFSPNSLTQYQVSPSIQENLEWWNGLQKPMSDGFSAWQHLHSQVKQLEDSDKRIDQAAQLRSEKQAKLNYLRNLSRDITLLITRRQIANKSLLNAQQIINNFDTENAQLIIDVQAESPKIQKNHSISEAYNKFVILLNAYNNKLPKLLVADLSEQVVELYNSFNRNDLPSELLATVKLPLSQNQRLEISFQNTPNQFYDPLHVLSEGHIRCMGLSILLAKNLKENCPLLIFDDPVNAIDDDHRESIRRTLFEDQLFAGKQIILTCHGEEFFKDIQNLLPAQVAADAQLITFLPRLEEPHINVDFNCAPRNYIIAARDHFNKDEIREALSKLRKAMESLTKGKIWGYVNKYGDGNLSLKLRAASAPIELRNLSEQLKSKIAKNDFSDPDKSNVMEPLSTLIGVNGSSREWRYLNKGTHEENDRAEFDRATVSTMISAVEFLDQAI
jgi:AAA15 family ATPase/GTPase